MVMDEFGTSYSSLSYLRHLRYLPLDTVKIDRSRITAIEFDAGVAMVGRGQNLRKTVVAEGVETKPSSTSCAARTAMNSRATCWSSRWQTPPFANSWRRTAASSAN